MSEEEIKQVWDDLFQKLNEKEKTFLAVVNNEKNKEIERLNNIIQDIETYIHTWNIEEIGKKTMLILNDILLIKNGMSDEVIRLKENK